MTKFLLNSNFGLQVWLKTVTSLDTNISLA